MGPRGVATADVYLEIGTKRTFAGAIEWPGWCRAGRDEASALGALVAYAPRYAAVVAGSGVSFAAPSDVTALRVVERPKGDATTDFGAPGKVPARDEAPMTERDLARALALLRACCRWPPRYFTRRAAWHVLDHVWEIEDRMTPVA